MNSSSRRPFWLRFALSALCLASTPACAFGVILQSANGWTEHVEVREVKAVAVDVVSAPPGAHITRRAPGGEPVELGAAPLTDSTTLERVEVVERPAYGGLVGGAVVEGLLGALIVVRGSQPDVSGDVDAFASGMKGIGAVYLTSAVIQLVVAIVRSQKAAVHTPSSTPSVTYEYRARSAGLTSAAVVVDPWQQTRVELPLFTATATTARASALVPSDARP